MERDRPPELDVRVIPPREKHPTIFATFRALETGEAFVLVNDHDPKPLQYQLQYEYAGQFGWEYLEQVLTSGGFASAGRGHKARAGRRRRAGRECGGACERHPQARAQSVEFVQGAPHGLLPPVTLPGSEVPCCCTGGK